MTDPAYIDVHSHLLPGIDDGCSQTDESLACVESLIDHGFRGTICTPHVCVEHYPGNTPEKVAQCVEEMQRLIDDAGLSYQLWSGAEVRIARTTIPWFRKFGVPTLGPSRRVLLDHWEREWEPFCDEVIDYLFQHGYQPILAHPERMFLPDDQLEALLDDLQSAGVWLQGNLRCIAGYEGARTQSRMLNWLTDDRYYMLATDMHHLRCLADRLEGLAKVHETVGQQKLTQLIQAHTSQCVTVD